MVIGGDAAGATAASTVKRRHPDWDVVMFEKGDWTSYAACGFPYALGGVVAPWKRLVARSPEEHRKRGIDVRIQTEATGIDLSIRKMFFIDHSNGRNGQEPFDLLVYATGAGEARPPIPGIEHGFFVQTPEQARRLDEKLKKTSHAVVVGGGYIGLEVAESLCLRKIETVLVDSSPQVMNTLDTDMAEFVRQAMQEIGVDVRLNTPLVSIERSSSRYAVHTRGETIETDTVILALGSKPRSRLASEAGIPLGDTGAVKVDHGLRSPVEGVFAAGDCAEVWHILKERWVNIHLGTLANKTGRVAGLNAAGGDARFPGALGTAVSKICRYEVARTGLSEREAQEIGLGVSATRIETRTRAGYYPGAGPIHVKLLASRKTGKLVGGQIVGTEGAAKRIDVVATAITAGMGPEDVVDLDLSYAPPFSPVWDPIQTAARTLGTPD